MYIFTLYYKTYIPYIKYTSCVGGHEDSPELVDVAVEERRRMEAGNLHIVSSCLPLPAGSVYLKPREKAMPKACNPDVPELLLGNISEANILRRKGHQSRWRPLRGRRPDSSKVAFLG